MLPHPTVPCRVMQDDDPAPFFPCELVSGDAGSLGFRLEVSIQRLERIVGQLVDVLATQQPTNSAFAEDVKEIVRRQDLRRSETFMRLQTNSLEEQGEEEEELDGDENDSIANDAVNDKPVDGTLSEDTFRVSSKKSELSWNLADSFTKGAGGGRTRMRTKSTIEQIYQTKASERSQSHSGWIAKVVMSTHFDTAISIIVIVNALMLGVQIDGDVKNKTMHPAFKYFEWVCAGIFTLELLLRLWFIGVRRMCIRTERLMTLIDISLVISSLLGVFVDILATSESGVETSSLLKVLRIGRLLRPLRAVALLGELRVIAAMIASSIHALFWLACIVCFLAYCFALILTEGAANYLREASLSSSLPEEYTEVQKEYGSLLKTMSALFLAMTGGRDWGETAAVIAHAGYVYAAIFVCFVFIMLFSVLNIVTGIFVDGAIELAKRDRAMMIEKKFIHRESNREHLLVLLSQVDSDGDGVISRDEFFRALQQGGVQEFMDALGIDPDNAAEVFLLLDADSDGVVNIMEFLQGMEKIRGEAKSVDIQMLLLHTRKIIDVLNIMQGKSSGMFGRTPVAPLSTLRKQHGRWDEPRAAHVTAIPVHVPGLSK